MELNGLLLTASSGEVQLKLMLTNVFTHTPVLADSEFPEEWSTLIVREEAKVS